LSSAPKGKIAGKKVQVDERFALSFTHNSTLFIVFQLPSPVYMVTVLFFHLKSLPKPRIKN
jgi:hypothetical protein